MKTKLCLIAFVALFCFSCKPINGPEGDTSGDAAHPTDTLFNYYANDSLLNIIFEQSNYHFWDIDKTKNHVFIIQSQEELNKICPTWVECPKIDFNTYCLVYAYITSPSISDRVVEHELVYNREQDEYNLYITIDIAESAWGETGVFLPYGLYKTRYKRQPINLQVTTDPIIEDKNPLIGLWGSSFEYEDPYYPDEYWVADEYVRFVSNNRMIYESVNDMSEFPDEGVFVFRFSHKEFSYEMTDTTLTLSYLPKNSYRDHITPGAKELPPLVVNPFEYSTKYTIIGDTTLVLWNFTHNGEQYKILTLKRIIDEAL